MVSRLWIPSIELRTNLSTRDGNCGQKRLDSPLMPWKVTQKRLKSLTSITGSMEGVRVDKGADVYCMNEKTFKELFPEVKPSVCSHEIQNFGNSVVDISILGQFCTYLQFRGEKYLNTFIVTNTSDCPNLLSHGATFRMGVLLPNYPDENVVRGENVPNFKINTSKGTSASNVFQILQDL